MAIKAGSFAASSSDACKILLDDYWECVRGSDGCTGDVDPDQGKTSVQIYNELKHHNCLMCKSPLPAEFNAYEHDWGTHVRGFNHKLWLSLHCHHCNYDWSIWKLKIE